MRGLVLRQPWASRIAVGLKRIETRRWRTAYRGPLLNIAGKAWDPAFGKRDPSLPAGVALSLHDLVDCRPMTTEDEHEAMCPCEPGRWAWVLANGRLVRPVPIRGQLGLFDPRLDRPLEIVEPCRAPLGCGPGCPTCAGTGLVTIGTEVACS